MKDNYLFPGRFGFSVLYKNHSHFAEFLKREYNDFYSGKDCCDYTICIGCLLEEDEFFFIGERRELVKDFLYENDDKIFVKCNLNYLRINLNEDGFEICYQTGFENSVLFYILECVLRIYAHRYGIDFFHASSFIHDGKVVMLNGFGGSGKTEIMVNFLLKGASFISDDLVLINELGEIYPYRVTIPLAWSAVTPEFVDRKKVSTFIYKICKYCYRNPGRLNNRIFGRLALKFLIGNHTYEQLSDNETPLKFYSVDYCYWIQESTVNGSFNISNSKFFDYMNLCLIDESRKYFDFEGFLLLKFPSLKNLIQERTQLRKRICKFLNPKGITVGGRNYDRTTNYLLKEIK